MLKVREFTSDDLHTVQRIQRRSFYSLLIKYNDYDTNPAMESSEEVEVKINRENTTAYIFEEDNEIVGWVRVIEEKDNEYKLAALAVLPEYQNKGIAQKAIKTIENIKSNAKKWTLYTILQEEGNCYLYEKLGYIRGLEEIKINEKMTLVNYIKDIKVKIM